jgi:hypothetical protein
MEVVQSSKHFKKVSKDSLSFYCDESCHLENDKQSIMVMGSAWCKTSKTKEIFKRIREIKQRHGLSKNFEIKWIKVSPGKLDFYRDIIDYFFDDDDIFFRVLIVPEKDTLKKNNNMYDHNDHFYQMYFNLLKVIIDPHAKNNIYLDFKDTKSNEKILNLKDVLEKSCYQYPKSIIKRLQTVRSHEVEMMQICDLLIGAVAYLNRNLNGSKAKLLLIDRIKKRSNYDLTKTTLLKESKFNIFRYTHQKGEIDA